MNETLEIKAKAISNEPWRIQEKQTILEKTFISLKIKIPAFVLKFHFEQAENVVSDYEGELIRSINDIKSIQPISTRFRRFQPD